MPHDKGLAATLEGKLIPFLVSIEQFLANAGLAPADYSSYTEIRHWFEESVPIIRSNEAFWAPTAEAAFHKLNTLQEGLPVILRRMPPQFTLQWNAIARALEKNNADLQRPS